MNGLPTWLTTGTAPQWGVFVVVVLALIRLSLPWRKLTIDSATQIRRELHDRIAELKEQHKECAKELAEVRVENADAIRKCRADCDEQTDKLEQKILGLQRQQIQEQISFINAIINSVDAPELKGLLLSLESVQAAQRASVLHIQGESVIQREQSDERE